MGDVLEVKFMTTIVVDTKNAKVYSDTLISMTIGRTTNHGFMVKTQEQWKAYNLHEYSKIYPFDDYIIAGSGCMDTLQKFTEQYPVELPTPKGDTVVLVLSKRMNTVSYLKFTTVRHDKKWYHLKKKPMTWKCESKIALRDYLALGSGEDVAMGALLAGASPEDAIKLTSLVDNGTNDKVVSFYIP